MMTSIKDTKILKTHTSLKKQSSYHCPSWLAISCKKGTVSIGKTGGNKQRRMENLVTRQCRYKDIETLRTLSVKTFTETFLADNTPDDINTYVAEHFSAQQLGRELDDANSMLLLVEYHATAVAYMKLNFEQAQTEREYPGSLEIQRIYVLKEFKGMHIGKHLVDTAVEIANREHLDYLWLGVWEHNSRAIAFYEKQGFKKFTTHSFKLGNDLQQDHIMRLDL